MAGSHDRITWWAWAVPAVGLGLAFAGLPVLLLAGVALAAVVIVAVFASVLHAEFVAGRVGVLPVAVTVI